ncbi:MAG: Na+/H+ antiporter NhaA [Pseudomonadota bacterium]
MMDVSSSPVSRPVQIIEPFQRFFKKFVTGSYPLFFATMLALIWANISAPSYQHIWHAEMTFALGPFQITKSLIHWIDEALMALFFFTVGLEIKREMLVGELASPKRALLPIVAALGGMVVPALIYISLNYGRPSYQGWGIPMATDIAFSLAVLAILGEKVPVGLKVFLSALAIADDLGAVLVIALFYTKEINGQSLLVSGVFLVALGLANRLWIRKTLIYALLGIGMWLAILGSGIHATVAGVLVALFVPARGRYDTDTFIQKVKGSLEAFECEPDSCGYTILLNQRHLNAVQAIDLACYDVETPLQRMEHSLQSWIALLILPLFALANSGLVLKGLNINEALTHPVTLGVALGLTLGKPIGISLGTYLAFKVLKTPLPSGVNWAHIAGVGLLGGIGFTMSLFISGLSFSTAQFTDFSKLGIIAGSIISGVLGLMVLHLGKASKRKDGIPLSRESTRRFKSEMKGL